MWDTDSHSLSSWVRDAYKSLEPQFEGTPDGLPRSDAQSYLLAESAAVEEAGDAIYALDRLLDRGWLYEVDGTLFKTE